MKKELYVIVHNIRSAHNVGAIFRSSDGAGVTKLYLTGYTPTPFTEEDVYPTQGQKMLAKTALGAEKTIPWEKVAKIDRVINKLKADGVQILGLEKTDNSIDLRSFNPQFPCALILGNEVDGIDDSTLDQCDAVVSLPMRGHKESLNVSVAAGIAIYEILK